METYLKALRTPRMAKKAQLGLLLASPFVLGLLAVIALLVVLSVIGLGFFLAFNVFTALGVFIVILATIMAFRGMVGQTTWGLFALGSLFILLPMVSDSLSGVSLAVLMP